MTRDLIQKGIREIWASLDDSQRRQLFSELKPLDAEELFPELAAPEQVELLEAMPAPERRGWLRLLAPDDAADLVQCQSEYLGLLDEPIRLEVEALLAYAEDQAGGLMSPRFARLRAEMTADQAITYLRRQPLGSYETIYVLYVLDSEQCLLGVVSLRDLMSAGPEVLVAQLMNSRPVTSPPGLDQEKLIRLFADHDLNSIPIVDADGVMQGIVTIDDIVDVVEEEATEDIQKIGGMEALEAPYLRAGFGDMLRKRGGWLTALFLGEMLTATAMGHYEDEISRAVVLALFVPLIISSGGNSGSQATTLVIRAMALGEVRLSDWWRVARRELAAGLCLGLLLGAVGLLRILLWQQVFHTYGDHFWRIGVTVAFSLVGVVMFGTLSGSMLPFVLRRVGFDPASASAPFVATLVDVTGLVIYFSVAQVVLKGVLL
ncbi:MAG: magnesium transporter [Candidatus Eremiobacteraeota bacterium]|nr:magnesium transporter [Candidatus Eremiobacteraeota bacterium]